MRRSIFALLLTSAMVLPAFAAPPTVQGTTGCILSPTYVQTTSGAVQLGTSTTNPGNSATVKSIQIPNSSIWTYQNTSGVTTTTAGAQNGVGGASGTSSVQNWMWASSGDNGLNHPYNLAVFGEISPFYWTDSMGPSYQQTQVDPNSLGYNIYSSASTNCATPQAFASTSEVNNALTYIENKIANISIAGGSAVSAVTTLSAVGGNGATGQVSQNGIGQSGIALGTTSGRQAVISGSGDMTTTTLQVQ